MTPEELAQLIAHKLSTPDDRPGHGQFIANVEALDSDPRVVCINLVDERLLFVTIEPEDTD